MSSFRDAMRKKKVDDVAADAVAADAAHFPPTFTPPPSADEPSPIFSAERDDDVEEARFEEVKPVAPRQSRQHRRNRLFSGGPSSRRQFLIGLIVIAFIVVVIAVVIGGSKNNNAATTTTSTTTTTTSSANPAVPIKGKKKAKKKPPAAIPATPLPIPTTSTTSSQTHTGGGGLPIPTVPKLNLGLPTAQEKAEAIFALDQAQSTLQLNYKAGSLVTTPAALECLTWQHTKYAISVVTTKPRPFLGSVRGQMVAAFGNQVGFVIIYTTAGKVGFPFLRTVHVRASNYRFVDRNPVCKLPPAGIADLNSPAPTH
jgi:hypothetical protein